MATKGKKLVAEICLYGNRETGTGWLAEHGRPREAALRRILVELGEDRHRLDYAGVLEREAAAGRAEAGAIRCHCRDGWVRSSDLYDEDEIVQADPCPYCDRWRLRRAAESDAARAEFIRVQVELARLDAAADEYRAADGPRVTVPRTHEQCREWKAITEAMKPLRRRERELLATHGATWATPVAKALGCERWGNSGITSGPGVAPRSWAWRRGFVAALILTAADLMRHAAGVFAAAPVEEVTLAGREPERHVPPHDAPNYSWYVAGFEDDRATIPEAVFDLLAGGRKGLSLGRRAYPTAEAARQDLSAAAVCYGRQAAHLPPLPARGPAAG